jgi:sulfur-oxidizing protein SoxY
MRLHPRRAFLRALGLGAALFAAFGPGRARAAIIEVPDDPAEAMRAVLGNVKPTKGKVALDMPYITETGTSVPIAIKVDSPMTEADHVAYIHVFADGNPVPRVASFALGPRAGKAEVATRIRLARSQRVTVVAALKDGSLWYDVREINVAQGACVDDTEGTLGSASPL